MSANAVICFAALLCAIVIVAEGMKQCKSQDDCPKKTHCCSKRLLSPYSYCVERRKLGQVCMHDAVGHTLYNGIYDITCPCEGELKCLKDEYVAENGVSYSFGNAVCRKPDYGGSFPPGVNPGNGNTAEAEANSVS